MTAHSDESILYGPSPASAVLNNHETGKALIAQNKGGGHGEIGYHLALKLIEKDISVTLLQDGAGKNKDKQPFARFGRRLSPRTTPGIHTQTNPQY